MSVPGSLCAERGGWGFIAGAQRRRAQGADMDRQNKLASPQLKSPREKSTGLAFAIPGAWVSWLTMKTYKLPVRFPLFFHPSFFCESARLPIPPPIILGPPLRWQPEEEGVQFGQRGLKDLLAYPRPPWPPPRGSPLSIQLRPRLYTGAG